MKKEKVYCRYCKYFESKEDGLYKSCLKEIKQDFPEAPSIEQIFDYNKQNANNDCEYYEYKKYKGLT